MTPSVPVSQSTPVPLPQPEDSLAARLLGIVSAPRATMAAVVAAPRWLPVLALTFAVTFASGALLLETEVGRLALVDQWERTAIAFGQQVDDARYAQLQEASEHGMLYAATSALASGPVLAVALATLLFGIFNGMLGGQARFVQVLAVVAYAGVVLALRQVIAAPLNYARETLSSPTTATVFFTMLDEASPLARFFGVIDVFVVWWAVVLALGIAVLYRRRAAALIGGFIAAYIGLAALLAVVMAMTGGTA